MTVFAVSGKTTFVLSKFHPFQRRPVSFCWSSLKPSWLMSVLPVQASQTLEHPENNILWVDNSFSPGCVSKDLHKNMTLLRHKPLLSPVRVGGC